MSGLWKNRKGRHIRSGSQKNKSQTQEAHFTKESKMQAYVWFPQKSKRQTQEIQFAKEFFNLLQTGQVRFTVGLKMQTKKKQTQVQFLHQSNSRYKSALQPSLQVSTQKVTPFRTLPHLQRMNSAPCKPHQQGRGSRYYPR